jgi:RHS repeat-associated protein
LGNVRLSYSDLDGNGSINSATEIIEENNYYPFGLKHEGYNAVVSSGGNSTAQKYQYNGKEWQDELGLRMYDYGWRNYDAAICRWMNIDPYAETYFETNPYSYVASNPTNAIDPNGLWIVNITSTTNSSGNTTFSLQFIAEKDDDINTLSKQLGISTDVLYGLKELENVNISENSSFSLGELSEVSLINSVLNKMFGATGNVHQKLNNCANIAAECNGIKIPFQWGSSGRESNTETFKNTLEKDFKNVSEGETKIGSIVHYQLKNK